MSQALCQLLEQLSLFFSQRFRCYDRHGDNLVAAAPVLKTSNALVPEPEIGAVLTAGRDFEFNIAFQGRHRNFRTQSCLSEVYRQFIVNIVTFTREEFVFPDSNIHNQVAIGSAAGTGITLTADADLITIVYSGGNFHRHGALVSFTTGAPAFGTRLSNNAAFAAAFRADGDIGKTSEDAGFYLFNLSAAITVGAALRRSAGLAAGTLALGAILITDNRDFFFTTKSSLFQCQADINLQRSAFFRSLTRAGGAAAEESFENIAETEVESIRFLAEEIHTAILAETVIGRPLGGVAKDFIGLIQFLEFFGSPVIMIMVGMILES